MKVGPDAVIFLSRIIHSGGRFRRNAMSFVLIAETPIRGVYSPGGVAR